MIGGAVEGTFGVAQLRGLAKLASAVGEAGTEGSEDGVALSAGVALLSREQAEGNGLFDLFAGVGQSAPQLATALAQTFLAFSFQRRGPLPVQQPGVRGSAWWPGGHIRLRPPSVDFLTQSLGEPIEEIKVALAGGSETIVSHWHLREKRIEVTQV